VRIHAKFDKEEKRWRLGFAPQVQVDRVDVGVLTAAAGALVYPWDMTKAIASNLYDIVTGKEKGDVGGPVRISEEISKAIEAGTVVALELLIMLNVYLGLFNLFPLPALDGGRLVFLSYELITRRRANPKIEATVHMIGILFLLVVMVLVTVKDCSRLF
jgi:regulator of sigma E protease